MSKAVQHIWESIIPGNTECRVPIFDTERPILSTGDMRTWFTGKPCEYTERSHINFCVYDSTGSGVFYDGKAIHTIEAVGHVVQSSHSRPFDTALRTYSGQAVDLHEATTTWFPRCRILSGDQSTASAFMAAGRQTALRGHAVGYMKRLLKFSREGRRPKKSKRSARPRSDKLNQGDRNSDF